MARKNNIFGDDLTPAEDLAKTVKKTIFAIFGFVVIILVLGVLIGSIYNVNEGNVGVMFSKWGPQQGFSPTEISQGTHFKMPFRDRVIDMPFRTQTISFAGENSITPKDSNGISFNIDVVVRYKIDSTQASEFIEQKGEGIAALETIMTTAIRSDATRGVLGTYAQEDVPENLINLAVEITKTLQDRINREASGKLKTGFILIETVDLRNVKFNPKIEVAIITKQEQKQVAEQKEYELQKEVKQKEITIVQATRDMEAQVLRATGEADAILLVAGAKAKGIRLVNDAYQSMPPEYVQVKFAEAIKPTDKVYFGFESLSGNTLPILDINEIAGLKNQGKIII